jgi:hypothetical protein
VQYLIVAALFLHAAWVFFDAHKRRRHTLREAAVWAAGTLVLWLFIVPWYFAKRNLKAGETREGGTGWNYLKGLVVLWTIVMAVVGVHYILASEVASAAHSGAAQAGAAIGVTLGVGLIAAVWLLPVVGALLLGLVLKKASVVEKGPTGPLALQMTGAMPPSLTACPTCGNAIVKGTPCPTCGKKTRPEKKLHGTVVVAGVMAAVLILGLLVLGLLKGRGTSKAGSATSPSEGATASPRAPAVPAAVADKAEVFTGSTAVFKGDLLDECVDFTIRVTPSADAGTDWREKIGANLRKMVADDKRATMLPAPCVQQFADRKPFASCTLSFPAQDRKGVTIEARSFRYLFATVFRSDAVMRECLQHGGKWEVLRHAESQEPDRGSLATVGDGEDALQFGKPTVRDTAFGMTRVIVQARNVTDRPVSCVVTATFMKGDTILSTANGSVNAIGAGSVKTAELMTTDRIRGYDTVRIETGGCF